MRDDGADELQWMRAEIQQWRDGGKPHGAIPRIQELERRISVIESSKEQPDAAPLQGNKAGTENSNSVFKAPSSGSLPNTSGPDDGAAPCDYPRCLIEGCQKTCAPPVQSADKRNLLMGAIAANPPSVHSAGELSREESAWLVEMVAARWGIGYFWSGIADYDQWGTIDAAVRFSRKEDAERVIESLHKYDTQNHRGKIEYEACEHQWMALRAAEPAGQSIGEGPMNAIPQNIQEWMWHMDLHLTEHDERHAGLALRAAWPTVKDWIARLRGSYIQLRNSKPPAQPEASKCCLDGQPVRVDPCAKCPDRPAGSSFNRWLDTYKPGDAFNHGDMAACWYAATRNSAQPEAALANAERVSQLIAHRAVGNQEQDEQNGKLAGYCAVCQVLWPCAYAGTPPTALAALADKLTAVTCDPDGNVCIEGSAADRKEIAEVITALRGRK